MTAKEMHISIQQDLQKINSAVFDNILPEEIDLAINKQQTRLIKNTFVPDQSGYFEDSYASTSEIHTLISETKIPVFNNKVELPPDFYYYLFSESRLIRCYESNTKKENKTVSVSVIDAEGLDYRSLNVGNGLNQHSFSYKPGANPWDYKDYFIKEFNERLNGENVFLYWEKTSLVNQTNKYIIVSYNVSDFWSINNQSATRKTFNQEVVKPLGEYTKEESPNRLARNEKILELNQNSFRKSNHKSPLLTISGNSINIHKGQDKSFIVNEILLKYIRKPLPVSLNLNVNSELPEVVHQKLCDMTTDYLKLIINSPDWQLKTQDTLNSK
jgi:hypothetical protein